MKKGVYVFPTALTLCTLFCGFYSILAVLEGNYLYAAWVITVANIFDGLDGWVARRTSSTTRFGMELDSLSDLVTFGVAPAVMLYMWALAPFGWVGWAIAFMFVACGALRLARYNIEAGSAESRPFTGMSTPAAATIVAAAVIFYYEIHGTLPAKNYFILILTVFLALLMVSTLRFHGAKELDFGKRKPFWVLVAIVIVLVVAVIGPPVALFLFAMAYLIGGIIENIFLYYRKRKQISKAGAAQ